ncbi:MAG: hypothetical protein U9N42_07660 [Campylobacterota bacterium]|nr:hypothetical protein [Campylobacterota bacterium]
MKISQKLDSYFETANNHIDMIHRAITHIKPYYPLQSDFKENIEDDTLLFALDSLIFRFAKLQDWLGQKIFKTFLKYEEYPVEDISFLEVIKVLEKENILSIDMWSVFREIRNELAHEYPNYEQIAQNINFVIDNSDNLINISTNLQKEFLRIKEIKNETH